MANIFISVMLVGTMLIIVGILQSLVSAMIPELEQMLNYSSGVISALLAIPAILSFVMIISMSFVFSKITVRQCIRLSALLCVLSMVFSAIGMLFESFYVSVSFALLGRIVFGIGWVPLQTSLYVLLRNRFSRSHMFIRNSLWNILITFMFAGIGLSYMFTPAVMELSIHLMSLVLVLLIVVMMGIAIALPGFFAEYINVKQQATTLNPPVQSVMRIVAIALYNFMTTGLWISLMLYLPSIITDWKEQLKIIDITFFSSFVIMGMVIAFFVSLFVTTKNRWLANIIISTACVLIGGVMTLLDYADPMLGVAVVIISASSFYMSPFIAANALFMGNTLYVAYQWIFASTFLGMSVYPAIFALTTLSEYSSLIIIAGCTLIFALSAIVGYVIWCFFVDVSDEEFANHNLNFLEVATSEVPPKLKGDENNSDSEAGSPVVDDVPTVID
jgi:hypothetical protein